MNDDDDTISRKTSKLGLTVEQALPGVPLGDACLVMIYGPDLGRKFALEEDLRVGRDGDNSIPLDLEGVSRRHAEIYLEGTNWYVKDLGSTNGTFVNDTRVEGQMRLLNGDLIKLGGAILKYLDGGNIESLFYEEIYRMTIFDGLTGIHNKRYLLDFLDREIARSARYGRDLSLAMFDIDHFKRLNDSFGHLAGDHVLRVMSEEINTMVRKEHLFARFGGEEFALVLPEQGLAAAAGYCEKIRRTVHEMKFEYDGSTFPVTISIGLACTTQPIAIDDFIRAADHELYRAKGSGRNRVVASGDEV